MADFFKREKYKTESGETRVIITPASPHYPELVSEAVEAAKKSGANVLFTSNDDLIAFAKSHNMPVGASYGSPEWNAVAQRYFDESGIGGFMPTDNPAMWGSDLFIKSTADHDGDNLAAGNWPEAPGYGNTSYVNLGKMGGRTVADYFEGMSGIPADMQTGVIGNLEDFERMVVLHEIGHLSDMRRVFVNFSREQIHQVQSESRADVVALNGLRTDFNAVAGFEDQARMARAIGAINSQPPLTAEGQFAINPYLLGDNFHADGSITESDKLTETNMWGSTYAGLSAIYTVAGLTAQGKTPGTPEELLQTFNDMRAGKPEARETLVAGYNAIALAETPVTRYEDIKVMYEAGIFSNNPNTQTVMGDYIKGMERYSNVEDSADLDAARQRLGPILDNPELRAALTNAIPVTPSVYNREAPAAQATAPPVALAG